MDKYTISVTPNAALPASHWTNKYFSDAADQMFGFGCKGENKTEKIIIYIAGDQIGWPEIHFVDSTVFPDGGNMLVGDWADYVYGLGIDTTNAFMHNKVQLFVPNISGHYETIVGSGALADKAILRLSKSDGSSTYDVAHISAQIPYAAHYFEILGPVSTLPDGAVDKFSAFADEECPTAHTMRFSLDKQIEIYNRFDRSGSAEWEAATGMMLPMGLTMQVSASSLTNLQSSVDFYSELLNFPVTITGSADSCQVIDVGISAGYMYETFANDDMMDGLGEEVPALRYVVNNVAPATTFSVADWEADIKLTHDTYLADDGSGWDRYLDTHVGLFEVKDTQETCIQAVDAISAFCVSKGFKSGPRHDVKWYAGIAGLVSVEVNIGCDSMDGVYGDMCGCIPENNNVVYANEFNMTCNS